MTVPVQTPVTASIANGLTTVFPFGFLIADEDDLSVTVDNVLQTSGYTVSGVGDPAGGNVTFAVAPADGSEVVRFLDPVLKRDTAFQQFGDWMSAVVNLEFDRIWLALQHLKHSLMRSIKLPVNTSVDQTITANAAARANKALKFDGDGNITISLYDPDDAEAAAVAAAASQSAAAASAAAALSSENDAETAATSAAASAAEALTATTFTQSGTGAVPRTYLAKMQERLTADDYGTDALVAFNAAATYLATGGKLRLVKGSYALSGPFVFAGQRLRIEGEGSNISQIVFDPASPAVAIEFNNPAAGGIYQSGVKGVGFSSSNSTAKTAIKIVNAGNIEIEDIGIPSTWAGDSIGIRSYGRQFLHVQKSAIACARPIVFSPNAAIPSICTDHFLIENSELIGTSATRPVIEFEDGVVIGNTTLRNLAIVGGKDGVKWVDTTSVGASFALAIEDFRTEQGMDTSGWSIDLEASASQSLQSLTIKNGVLDSARNGIKLRRVQRIAIENTDFNQTSGTQLDIEMVAGGRLILKNCFHQTGGTKTITNGRCVRRSMSSTAGYTTEEWVYDNAAAPVTSTGAEISDVYHQGSPVVVPVDGILQIAARAFKGFIMVSTSENVSAIYNLMGTNDNTNEAFDPSGFFSKIKDTATSYNIYYDSGTTSYVLQNKRPVQSTISIYKIGC